MSAGVPATLMTEQYQKWQVDLHFLNQKNFIVIIIVIMISPVYITIHFSDDNYHWWLHLINCFQCCITITKNVILV